MKIGRKIALIAGAAAAVMIYCDAQNHQAPSPVVAENWTLCRGGEWCKLADVGGNLGIDGNLNYLHYYESRGPIIIWADVNGKKYVLERKFSKNLQKSVINYFDRFHEKGHDLYISWRADAPADTPLPWEG